MKSLKAPHPDLHIKFELSSRRGCAGVWRGIVIGIVLIGVAERLVRLWIET